MAPSFDMGEVVWTEHASVRQTVYIRGGGNVKFDCQLITLEPLK